MSSVLRQARQLRYEQCLYVYYAFLRLFTEQVRILAEMNWMYLFCFHLGCSTVLDSSCQLSATQCLLWMPTHYTLSPRLVFGLMLLNDFFAWCCFLKFFFLILRFEMHKAFYNFGKLPGNECWLVMWS